MVSEFTVYIYWSSVLSSFSDCGTIG